MNELTIAGTRVRLTGGEDHRGGGTGPLVVLLHGFGAPGDDLVPLHRQLDVPREVRFAFPEAPLDLGEALGRPYAGARAWWLIDPEILQASARGERVDRTGTVPEGLAAARAHVEGVLAELAARLGVPRSRTVLGGFSQGAMLTLDVALRGESPFAGHALLSGTLLARTEWTPALPKLARLPVLQSHGRADPVLPFDAAVALRDLLRGADADLRWVEFAGGHTITGAVLDALGTLVRDALTLR